jgi:uncharacterized protein YfaT (DUF1175 family)
MGLGLFGAGRFMRHGDRSAPRVTIRPDHILANGYDAAILTIESAGPMAPRVVVENPHAAAVRDTSGNDGRWRCTLAAGVLPGRVRIRVEAQDAPPAFAELLLDPDDGDRFGDGTPDCLRLDRERDRQVFRRWFTWLAEAQYFQPAASRAAEIADCAALIRYAYRETLRAHESGWAEAAQVPVVPAFDSVAKYHYPFTLLGGALFRVRPGVFQASDASNGAFAQFADAKTLCRLNTYFIGRDLGRARAGDLLFFRQSDAAMAYHSMIYEGESPLRPDGARYVVYHTGPDGDSPGEIRRLRTEELLRFPRPEWQPIAENPSFLGVYRWNILRGDR